MLLVMLDIDGWKMNEEEAFKSLKPVQISLSCEALGLLHLYCVQLPESCQQGIQVHGTPVERVSALSSSFIFTVYNYHQ